ncbi:bifunctional purple acid phosphatase 26 [Tanacetum coccineum]
MDNLNRLGGGHFIKDDLILGFPVESGGESMRAAFESWFCQYKVDVIFARHVHAHERSYRISKIHYNVTGGASYPIPDKSARVYITVGDGGNQEGLALSYSFYSDRLEIQHIEAINEIARLNAASSNLPPQNIISSSSAIANSPAFVRPSRTPTSTKFGSALNIETLVAAAEHRETPIDETIKVCTLGLGPGCIFTLTAIAKWECSSYGRTILGTLGNSYHMFLRIMSLVSPYVYKIPKRKMRAMNNKRNNKNNDYHSLRYDPEAIEELVNRRMEEALVAHEEAYAANALEAENQSQNGSDGDNRNGGNGNGGNENGRGDRPVARECTY